MNYEKKYKEALVKLKEHFTPTSDGIIAGISRELIEDIFPELRESEDERIRKALTQNLKERFGTKGNMGEGLDMPDVLAWLEKQGEPTDINPSEFDLRLNKLLKQFETLPKEELASSLSFYLNVVQNDGTYKAEEKQCEQKPTDEVEPKFHEGEWVVQENIGVYKVIEVCESWYEVVDNKDKHYSIGFDKEYMCHLYTIQDANDGDVLYSQTHHLIWIYKDSEHYHASINLNYADVVSFDSEIVVPSNVCPANRVQKSILFQKMEEAGYKWDAEKLELKKAEDEEYNGEDYGIDSLFHAQRILEKTLGKVDGYQTDDGILAHQCAISAVKKLYEQKPTETVKWSAREEYCICELEAMVREAWGKAENVHNDVTIKKMQELMFFLKTLNPNKKPTVWSEEDKDIRNTIIRDLKRLGGDIVNVKPAYKEEVGWLKSLEQRIGWKPTKEQMEALHDLNLTGGISYAGQGQVLIELYNDLKKL